MTFPSECYCSQCNGDVPCYVTGDCDIPHCKMCGATNYHYLGYLGNRKRWAKHFGITEEEMERQWQEKAKLKYDSSSDV